MSKPIALMSGPSGYFCPVPVQYVYQGDGFERPCGHCDRCLAVKKRDLSARAAAESATSDEVVAFTLTYRPGEPGAFKWVTADRQKFVRRLRDSERERARQAVGAPVRRRGSVREYWAPVIAAATRRVRYFGCGEIGSRGTKRHHWHVVAFFSGGDGSPSGLVSTPLQTDGKKGHELISSWPHGWANVHVLPLEMSARLKAIRYCVAYLHKARGAFSARRLKTEPEAVIFRSLKPGLGSEYLSDWARSYADAGLPLPGAYSVAGLTFSRGKASFGPDGLRFSHGARLIKNNLHGVARRDVILAYRDAWVTKYGPERDMPPSDFRARFDPEFVDPCFSRPSRGVWRSGATGKPFEALPAVPDGLQGMLFVRVGGDVVGMVRMLRNGVCVWCPNEGDLVYLNDPSLRGVLDLTDAAHLDVESWILRQRSPDARSLIERKRGVPMRSVPWVSPKDRFEAFEARRVRRIAALSKGFGRGLIIGDPAGGGLVPLTAMYRKLVLSGDVRADGVPIGRVYRPPRDLEKLLSRDDFPNPEPFARPAVAYRRPAGDMRLRWENCPRWIGKPP